MESNGTTTVARARSSPPRNRARVPPTPDMSPRKADAPEGEDIFSRVSERHPFVQKHSARSVHSFVPNPPGAPAPPGAEGAGQNLQDSGSGSGSADREDRTPRQRRSSFSSARSMPSIPYPTSEVPPMPTRPGHLSASATPAVPGSTSRAVSAAASMSTSALVPSRSSRGPPARRSDVPRLTESRSTISPQTLQSVVTDDSHSDLDASKAPADGDTPRPLVAWDDDLPQAEVDEVMDEPFLRNATGDRITPRSIIAQGKSATILFFIRHLWCGSCHDYMLASVALLDKAALDARGIHVAVISCGGWEGIAQYSRAMHCEFDLYADPERQLFMQMGFRVGWVLDDMGPARKLPYHQHGGGGQFAHGIARSVMQIRKGVPTVKSTKQQGGEVIFAPDGRMLKLHRMRNSCDHMEALDVVKAAGVALEPKELDFNPKAYFPSPLKSKPKQATEDDDDSMRSKGDISDRRRRVSETSGRGSRLWSKGGGGGDAGSWNARIVTAEQRGGRTSVLRQANDEAS